MMCKNFEKRQTTKVDRMEQMLQLWREVAVAVAGADSTKSKEVPARWADAVTGDYADRLAKLKKEGVL